MQNKCQDSEMEDNDISIEAMRNYLKGVYYKDKLDEDTLSPYTKKELDLLNRAYNYEYFKDSENPTLKGVYHDGPIEKSSVNRELRYRIYDATGLVGKELDEYIDIIPDDLLLKFYYTMPYTSSLKDE